MERGDECAVGTGPVRVQCLQRAIKWELPPPLAVRRQGVWGIWAWKSGPQIWTLWAGPPNQRPVLDGIESLPQEKLLGLYGPCRWWAISVFQPHSLPPPPFLDAINKIFLPLENKVLWAELLLSFIGSICREVDALDPRGCIILQQTCEVIDRRNSKGSHKIWFHSHTSMNLLQRTGFVPGVMSFIWGLDFNIPLFPSFTSTTHSEPSESKKSSPIRGSGVLAKGWVMKRTGCPELSLPTPMPVVAVALVEPLWWPLSCCGLVRQICRKVKSKGGWTQE